MSWREHLQNALPPSPPARAPGDGLIHLDLNEGAFAPTGREAAALQRALESVPLNRYPDDSATELRGALARKWHVDPEEILVGNGSIEIIACLMLALRRPGAHVLFPVPTFEQYAVLAAAHGLGCIPVPLGPHFRLDEGLVVEAIDRQRPVLGFFASPNNPTGNTLDGTILQRLARRMGGVLVVDEAYADFAGRTLLPLVRETEGLFVMRSLSKVGLAGLRIGALVGPREAIAAIRRARLPFSVGAASQALGCAALGFSDVIEARVRMVVEIRQELETELRRIPGIIVYPSEANFLLVRLPGQAHTVVDRMRADRVSIRDVSMLPALERCVRITVGSRDDNRRCVEALHHALEAEGKGSAAFDAPCARVAVAAPLTGARPPVAP
jgi:histidinol-phosphate aminotransferase